LFAEYTGEKILKIDPHLAKMWIVDRLQSGMFFS